jgi:hypothetical protein
MGVVSHAMTRELSLLCVDSALVILCDDEDEAHAECMNECALPSG